MRIEEQKSYMLIQDEIRLHRDSVQYMEVLKDYEEVSEAPEYFVKPIIHIYAKEDTVNEEGGLDGYNDSLFFECKVYDPFNQVVYTSTRLHDSVDFYGVKPDYVRIFKDGSTLVSFSESVKIGFLQAVTTYKN